MSDGRQTYDYSIRVSPRAKRIILKVSPDRGLEVVVPREIDRKRVPEVIARRRSWIEKQFDSFLRSGVRPGETAQLPAAIEFAATGERFEVSRIERPGRSDVKITGPNRLLLCASEVEEGVSLLRRWLKKHARDRLVPMLRETGRETGLDFARVQVRLQRSRWASCSARGTVSLNARLMFLPPELVNYVFVHELCHTKHMNHSGEYWRTVAGFIPDFEQLEARLKREGRRLVPAWAA